jgi:hypothetical protein
MAGDCPNLMAALRRKTTPAPDPVDEFFASPLWERVLPTDTDKFIKSIANGIPQA